MRKTTPEFILHVLISYFVSNLAIWEPEVGVCLPVLNENETQNLDIGAVNSSG